jgi:hypothetical protein
MSDPEGLAESLRAAAAPGTGGAQTRASDTSCMLRLPKPRKRWRLKPEAALRRVSAWLPMNTCHARAGWAGRILAVAADRSARHC